MGSSAAAVRTYDVAMDEFPSSENLSTPMQGDHAVENYFTNETASDFDAP